MAIRHYKKISELNAITSASLSTYVAGVDNGETVRITLDVLADGVRNTINTIDIQRLNALEAVTGSYLTSLNGTISGSSQLTSSYDERYVVSGSITQTTWDNIANKPAGLISESADLSSLNNFTSSQQILNVVFTNGISARLQTSSFNEFSQSYVNDSSSFDSRLDTLEGYTDVDNYVTTSSFNDYTASISTGSLVDRLNSLESNSGSYLTSLDGAITSSQQITDFGFVSGSYETTGRGILSGSISYNDLTNIPQGLISQSTDLTSLNSFTHSIESRVVNLENNTGSYLTSLNGTISSSTQIEALGFITGVVDIDNFATTASNTFYGEQTISGSLIPMTDGSSYTSSFSLGSPTNAWKDLYVSTGSIHFVDKDGQVADIISANGNGLKIGNLTVDNGITGSLQYSYLVNVPTLISGTSQIEALGFITSSQTIDTSSFVTTTLYNTDSASFDSRITNINVGTASIPAGTISGSAQITALGFISESVVTDLISLNTFTASYNTDSSSFTNRIIALETAVDDDSTYLTLSSYNTDSSSFDARISNLVNTTVSYETTGRGIISESVVTISETQPTTGVGNLWYDSNGGNLYLHYDTNTWVDTSNGVIQTIINDGSLLSTASFNAWTSSYTTPLPAGVISGSSQITGFETTGRNIISSSTQLSALGYVQTGGNVTFNSVTAQQYVVSSSVYYVTASYSSGSTIFGNTADDTHQFTGSVLISGSLTANLTNGYFWVGNSLNRSYEVPTASFATTASLNSFTASYYIDSASAATSRTAASASLATLQSSLGSTSTAFTYTAVTNPSAYVLVSYPTASFNGGIIDILLVNTGNSTATSAAYQFASFGANAGISQNGKQTSGAGAPSPTMAIAQVNGNIQIRVTETGTFNIKGVARLF